jgi:hypothetical protein
MTTITSQFILYISANITLSTQKVLIKHLASLQIHGNDEYCYKSTTFYMYAKTSPRQIGNSTVPSITTRRGIPFARVLRNIRQMAELCYQWCQHINIMYMYVN